MARKVSIEQQLAALRGGGADAVRAAIATGAALVIEAAAKRAGEHQINVGPELAAAFAALPKGELACRAKIAIAQALHALEHWDDRVFVAGLTVSEGAPTNDSAAPLRGICAIAHAHFNRPDALEVLAAALADPCTATRLGAAQGLRDCAQLGAAALLRYKLLLDDDDPDVVAGCVEALIATGRDACEVFLVGLLGAHDQRAEIIALGLGGARMAVPALLAWSTDARPAQRQRVGFLALALARDDRANAHLLEIVRTGGKHDALAATRALATFEDDKVAAQIRDAASDLDLATQRELLALLGTL